MNKQGKESKLLWVVGIGILLILGLLVFAVVKPTQNTALSSDNGKTGGATIVTTSTVLSPTAVDAAKAGTSVTSSYKFSVAGAPFATLTSGTTTANQGDVIDLIANASGYHSAIIEGHKVPNGITNDNTIRFALNKNASVTITAFNNNNQVIDNTATNYTTVVGTSPNVDIKFQGTSQASTQDMTCILESNNKTAIDSSKGITMSGATVRSGVSLNFYTLSGTSAYTAVYDIPALTDSSDVHHSVSVNALSDKDLSASTLKVTCYTKEHFIDSNTGKLVYDIQDSSGTLQSAAQYTTTVQFT